MFYILTFLITVQAAVHSYLGAIMVSMGGMGDAGK